MKVIYTDYFFLDFQPTIVKYNIYGLGRFADNHIIFFRNENRNTNPGIFCTYPILCCKRHLYTNKLQQGNYPE